MSNYSTKHDPRTVFKHQRNQYPAYQEDPRVNPDIFKGFRFISKEDKPTNLAQGQKPKFSSIHPEFTIFRYGRHAFYGRFFVIIVINAIVGWILSRFELNLADGQVRPLSITWETVRFISQPELCL